MRLERHYSNPASLIPLDVAAIDAATKTIDIAAYCMVEPNIIGALVAAAQRGVQLRLYLDRTELESEAHGDAAVTKSPLHALAIDNLISIRVKQSSVLMHLKSYLIDGSLLRDGSANFSTQGETNQDNDLQFTDDPAAIAAFQAKFEQMWAREDNLSIAAAVARPAVQVTTYRKRR